MRQEAGKETLSCLLCSSWHYQGDSGRPESLSRPRSSREELADQETTPEQFFHAGVWLCVGFPSERPIFVPSHRSLKASILLLLPLCCLSQGQSRPCSCSLPLLWTGVVLPNIVGPIDILRASPRGHPLASEAVDSMSDRRRFARKSAEQPVFSENLLHAKSGS